MRVTHNGDIVRFILNDGVVLTCSPYAIKGILSELNVDMDGEHYYIVTILLDGDKYVTSLSDTEYNQLLSLL